VGARHKEKTQNAENRCEETMRISLSQKQHILSSFVYGWSLIKVDNVFLNIDLLSVVNQKTGRPGAAPGRTKRMRGA